MARVSDAELHQLARELGDALHVRGWMVATAESCTGGWAGQLLTAIPGSSAWFERGFITYANAAKQEMLGVPATTLETCGAVSEETASAMAAGALAHSHAQAALAISGIAGPGGGTPQ
ncbi:MAG: damage-inducible protein CinA, partial [Hydrogenophilales bacterium 17-62-8]